MICEASPEVKLPQLVNSELKQCKVWTKSHTISFLNQTYYYKCDDVNVNDFD